MRRLTHAARAIGPLAALVLIATPAIGHVDYVVDDPDRVDGFDAFATALTDPGTVAIFAGGAIAFGALAAGWSLTCTPGDVRVLAATLDDYERYVPWMLRLSLGRPLVGAGFAGFLCTPTVPTTLRLLQVVVGFAQLLGLVARAAAVGGPGRMAYACRPPYPGLARRRVRRRLPRHRPAGPLDPQRRPPAG
jgi:hypothetical protein